MKLFEELKNTSLSERLLLFSLLVTIFFTLLTSTLVGYEFGYSGVREYSVSFAWFDAFIIAAVGFTGFGLLWHFRDREEAPCKLDLSRPEIRTPLRLFAILFPIAFISQIPNYLQSMKGLDEGLHILASYFFTRLARAALSPSSIPGLLAELSANYSGTFQAATMKFPIFSTVATGIVHTIYPSPISIMAVSTLMGVLCAVSAYFLMKEYGVKKELLNLVPFFVFFIPAIHYWSGRPMLDIFLVCFITASWAQLKRAIRTGVNKDWILFGFLAALGFLSKYEYGVSGIGLALLALYYVIRKRDWANDFAIIKGGLLSLAFFAVMVFPWSYLFFYKVPYYSGVWGYHIGRLVVSQPGSPAYLPSGVATQLMAATALLFFAVVLDAFTRKNIKRLEIILFALPSLWFFSYVIYTGETRFVLMLLVAISVYIFQVLSANYSKYTKPLVIIVVIANIVFLSFMYAGSIESGHADYIDVSNYYLDWEEVVDYLATFPDERAICTIPEPLQYYASIHGKSQPVFYNLDRWNLDNLPKEFEAHGTTLFVTQRHREVPECTPLRTFEGNEAYVHVCRKSEK